MLVHSLPASSSCPDSFSELKKELEKNARPGNIPGFLPHFDPAFNIAELEKKAIGQPLGTSVHKFSEGRQNTWDIERRLIDGEPKLVAVKRTSVEDEATNITKALRKMKGDFAAVGLDKFIHVALPIETESHHMVFPVIEARDFGELSRGVTSRLSTKKLKDTSVTGGPPTKGHEPQMDLMWDRLQDAFQLAVVKLKKMGLKVSVSRKKSLTTGQIYIESMDVMPARAVVGEDFTYYSIRASDILVTTDGRFVIIDPY